ncbi:hypothetical protein [Hymenobacter sp. CRA2]|uniref:hypothetical protein n=1 Tax=Hymenobacter sp. CRA2 TaxID=1955620 RepID=UPI00098F897C|nr:hypothetical protein [Hymenobacter sp. CRA2]OON67703.1 hypothetical protein B0919_16000 [Hymenobacter sp. CRA2]
MFTRRLIWPLALLSLFSTACARQQFAARTVQAAPLTAHRSVAILPFDVALDRLRLRDLGYLGTDPSAEATRQAQDQWTAQHEEERRTTAYALQNLLHQQLLAQQPARGYTVDFLSADETNRRLRAAGISYENLLDQSMPALQQALGVDAVLFGRAELHQPLPKGVELATRLLFNEPLINTAGAVDGATATLALRDARSGELAWSFSYERGGTNALQPARLTRHLVKAAAPALPYRRP